MSTLRDQILQALDVRGFYSACTKLTASNGGEELKGLCPLHQEKTPSFFVRLSDGSFNCFGCGKGGGPIQFYAAKHDLDYFQTVQSLAEELGIRSPATAGCPGHDRGPARILLDLPATSSATAVYAAVLKLGRPLPEKVVRYFEGRAWRSLRWRDFRWGFSETRIRSQLTC